MQMTASECEKSIGQRMTDEHKAQARELFEQVLENGWLDSFTCAPEFAVFPVEGGKAERRLLWTEIEFGIRGRNGNKVLFTVRRMAETT